MDTPIKRIEFLNSESSMLRGSWYTSLEDAAHAFSWARYGVKDYGTVDKATIHIEFKDGTIYSTRADVPHIESSGNATLHHVLTQQCEHTMDVQHRIAFLSNVYSPKRMVQRTLELRAQALDAYKVLTLLGLRRAA